MEENTTLEDISKWDSFIFLIRTWIRCNWTS